MTLAEAFTRHEAMLPEIEQTPFTATITQLLQRANTTQMLALQMESQRKEASQAFKRTEEKAVQVAHQIRNLLASRFPNTPEMAQAWGLIVRQTGRNAGQVLLPQKRQEMQTFLSVYIQKEQSLPAAEQIQQPALADVVALREDLLLQKHNRDSALGQRVLYNSQLSQICMDLVDQLRRALGFLLLVNYGGEPSRELEQWGFHVVTRTSGSNGDAEIGVMAAPNGSQEPA